MRSNSETLRSSYEALNQGDISKVLEVIDEDIVWQEGALSPEAGSHRGRESFEAFFRSWLASFDQFTIEPLEVIERGDVLIAVVRQSGRGQASGIAVSVEIAHAWTIREGRAVRWQAFGSREDALEALPGADAGAPQA
jgi:ketosteroid isomerase-like protein